MELKRSHYFRTSFVLAIGTTDQLLDVFGGIVPVPQYTPFPNYLVIATTVDITVRINSTSAPEIPVTAAAGLTIPANCRLEISKLYFTHGGASSGLGDASVSVLAI